MIEPFMDLLCKLRKTIFERHVNYGQACLLGCFHNLFRHFGEKASDLDTEGAAAACPQVHDNVRLEIRVVREKITGGQDHLPRFDPLSYVRIINDVYACDKAVQLFQAGKRFEIGEATVANEIV